MIKKVIKRGILIDLIISNEPEEKRLIRTNSRMYAFCTNEKVFRRFEYFVKTLTVYLGKELLNKDVKIKNYFTHAEMGQYLGCSRQTVTTLIGLYSKDGYIFTRKYILVPSKYVAHDFYTRQRTQFKELKNQNIQRNFPQQNRFKVSEIFGNTRV